MKALLAFSALIVLAACAQVTATRGATFVDPAWQGTRLNSIVVDTRSGTLGERQAIETSAVATLQRTGASAIPGMNVVPPTRDTGETARRRKIMNTGAQAVLEIEPREHQIVESYMPGTQYRDMRRHHRYGFDRDAYWDDPFYYDPPLVLQEPEIRFEATLYSLPHYDKIWTADITTRGPTGMSYDEVAANFGRELVERLAKDGLVAAPR
jgi:hypothetical protein